MKRSDMVIAMYSWSNEICEEYGIALGSWSINQWDMLLDRIEKQGMLPPQIVDKINYSDYVLEFPIISYTNEWEEE